MSDLESVPGTALSCNVFSPRLRRPNAVELSMDMGYCGRATGIFRAVGMGAQGRFSQHQRYIRHASLSRRKKVGFSEQFKTGNRRLELGFRLRLQNMPSRGFVGLNCALPAFQPVNLHGVRHFSGYV
jgi:hypothetical protein